MKRKMSALLLCAGLIAGSSAMAQTPTQQVPQQQQQQQIEVSDAELEKFAEAYQGIQVANQDAQQKMIAVVEAEDLEIAKFNEIHQARMQNQEVNATEQELERHASAVEKIEEMQPEIQAEMEEIITDADLTVDRYQEIATAMQNDPQLQQRLQQIMVG